MNSLDSAEILEIRNGNNVRVYGGTRDLHLVHPGPFVSKFVRQHPELQKKPPILVLYFTWCTVSKRINCINCIN